MSSNRALTAVTVAAFTGFLAGAATVSLLSAPLVAAKNTAVQGNSFVLLDHQGKKRGEWIIDQSGGPTLRMLDERGNVVWDTAGGVYRLSR